MKGPRYEGASLLNLVAELELRLTGAAPAPPLNHDLASLIPSAATYVLVLLDGLGDGQLVHPAAAPLATSRRAAIDACFPTTTTVNLATIATGLSPTGHGILGHHMWMPEVGAVVNTLRWKLTSGDRAAVDVVELLPAPNLWERLRDQGCEPITVQPAGFDATPLSQALYRGCRFETIWNIDEAAAAAAQLASQPGRLIFLYLHIVDVSAHLYGQQSAEYTTALSDVSRLWDTVARALPDNAAMVGTADHGHIDYGPDSKHRVSTPPGVAIGGDPRGLLIHGDTAVANGLPGRLLPPGQLRELWGPGAPHPQLDTRQPDALLLAADGSLLLPGNMDRRLVGYHGGLSAAELEVPLLVA